MPFFLSTDIFFEYYTEINRITGSATWKTMETNERIVEFMMRLTEGEEPIVSRLRELALQISGGMREDIKWNALCFFKGERAFVGIMPLEDHPWGDRGFAIQDPNGITLYIYSDREPSEEFKQYFK